MVTITVDDRQLVVTRLINILDKVVPAGVHTGFSSGGKALEYAADTKVDVAFLDVEMPDMSGIELCRRLQEMSPRINIVFITGYKEYAMDALELYASGYLLKPVREDDVRNALAHLRYPIEAESGPAGMYKKADIRVQCFGNFEIYLRDEVLSFPRVKCKDLIALLIDRRGAVCTNDKILGALWPDREPNASLKSMMRTMLADTKKALEAYGVQDLLIKEAGGVRIDTAQVDCDYYRFLEGDPKAVQLYAGEYMSQYAFAEETRAFLTNNYKTVSS